MAKERKRGISTSNNKEERKNAKRKAEKREKRERREREKCLWINLVLI
jgi:Mg2+/citrate symporter